MLAAFGLEGFNPHALRPQRSVPLVRVTRLHATE